MSGEGRAGQRPHQPVLYQEIIHALRPKSGGRYVDATLGAGGHAEGILHASAPDGELLGLDVDPAALAIATERLAQFGARVTVVRGSYVRLSEELARLGWAAVDGIVVDLGASSMQFDQAERGFSFRAEGPLDMRFDPENPVSASELVNELPESELADLIYRYGEERQSRRVARAIARARPLKTTTELAQVVRRAMYTGSRRKGRGERIHPATRTFQALRMAVNEELEALQSVLPQTVEALKPGGRVAIIAFHSLEDRIVKQYFRQESSGTEARLALITRRPIRASDEEVGKNPRARSARLRVAEKR